VSARLVRATLLGFALCTGLVGCDRLHEVKRCRGLAQRVNTSLDKIEATSNGGKTGAAYGAIATEYDGIAQGLEGFDAGTPELTKAVEDYATLARTTARQSKTLAQALDANNKGGATLATHELERLARQERMIVMRIDEECRPK
jgi:hypothetical protein